MTKKKEVHRGRKGKGVPARKASRSRASGVASLRSPKTAEPSPSARSRASAQPAAVELPRAMRRQFDAYMDIGWSMFAITEMAKSLKRPNADVDGIQKAVRYHLKAIIRNKKIIGDDSSKEEQRLVELNALAARSGAKQSPHSGTERKRATKGSGRSKAKATPKKK